MLTLSIRGLCGVTYKPSTPRYEVLLSSHHEHVPTLSAFTEFLDAEKLTDPWPPDSFAYVPVPMGGNTEFKQVAIWNLKGKRVVFTKEAGQKLETWDNRADAIDFAQLHKDSTVKAALGLFGVAELHQGKPSSHRLKEFKLTNDSGEQKVRRATEIRWTGLSMLVECNGLFMKFQTDASARNPFAMLSSVAPEPVPARALAHFHLYYQTMVKDKNGDEIDPKLKFKIARATDETYDCVPPGALPPLP